MSIVLLLGFIVRRDGIAMSDTDSEMSAGNSMESLEQNSFSQSIVSTSQKLGTKMLYQLNEFREDGTLCDAKLQLEGKDFNVHRVILASSCSYFRSLFTTNMKERKQETIELKCPGDLVEHMNDFLTFLYTTKVQLTTENVEGLIVAADYFNVTELKEMGCRFLQQNVNITNGIALHGFAGRYHCEPLREITRDFLVENFTAISQTEEYLYTDPEQLLEIVSNDELVIFEEEELYEGILRWVKYDLTSRSGFFPELFSKVRLRDVKRSYLAENIAKERLVMNDSKCSDLLMQTILDCYVTGESSTSGQPSRFLECVFVNGGREPSGATASSYIYVPSRNTWFKINSMSTVRYSHGVGTIRDNVFVLGGYSKSGFTAEVERFNIRTRKWSTSQSLQTPMKGMAAEAVGDFLYVAGGIVENGIRLGVLKRYHPETESWEVKAPLHVSRSGACLVAVGVFLYAIGGKASDNQMLSSVERYSIENNTWEMMSEMSQKRAYAVAATLANGNILVVGGINEVGDVDTVERVVVRTYLRSCEMFNPTAGVWFPVSDLSVPRAFSGIAVHGNKVYVFGGEGTDIRYHPNVECYSYSTNQWDVVSQMPEPKKFLQCCQLMLPQGLFRNLPDVIETN